MKKRICAAAALAATLLLTACGSGGGSGSYRESSYDPGNYYYEPQTTKATTPNTTTTAPDTPAYEPEPKPEPEPEEPKELGVWDVLPEIPETSSNALMYEYRPISDGMCVTDYVFSESPKIRIPETIEGERVVLVDFSGLDKSITEIVVPESAGLWLSDEATEYLKYLTYSGGIFYGCQNLKAVYIHKTITTIGLMNPFLDPTMGTFANCPSLETVYIPDGVTAIGGYTFYDCTGLTDLNIPDSVTEIGEKAFDGCTNIKATYKGNTYDYSHIQDLYDAINGI